MVLFILITLTITFALAGIQTYREDRAKRYMEDDLKAEWYKNNTKR